MNVDDILEAFWCATKEIVQKLDSTETIEGHEVYYVDNEKPLMISHEGHELPDLSH